jgi:hypothetical protein
MNINNRVEMLIKKVATNKASFSSSTGISSVILSHISSGRNKVSLKAVEQILKAYPKVNADWLVLGKGPMFKDALDHNLIQELKDSIEDIEQELNATVKSLKGKIDLLTSKLEG